MSGPYRIIFTGHVTIQQIYPQCCMCALVIFRSAEFYIGLYNVVNGQISSDWVWRSDNTPLYNSYYNPYTNWKSGNPSKDAGISCVVLNNNKKWDDHGCNHKADGYICECDSGQVKCYICILVYGHSNVMYG